jgi:hypothetical protein
MVSTLKRTIFAILILGLLVARAVTVVGADLAPGEVLKAMAKGVKYLEGSQRDDGTWSEHEPQHGGVTALCTLALLNAGESPNEPHVKQALAYLRNQRFKTTYVVALQTMVLCRANPIADQELIAENVRWLEDNQILDGPNEYIGGWSYGEVPNSRNFSGDPSNSQFALLALYEAGRMAESYKVQLKIEHGTWDRVRSYWVSNQNAYKGFWGYKKAADGTGSMTCAGIASLVIADDILHDPDAKVSGNQIDPCWRGPSEVPEKINKGVEWLAGHFSVQSNPQSPTPNLWHYYYLYGLERAGRLSSRRKIGAFDWYREGARHLVGALDSNLRDYWQGSLFAEEKPDISTSLALLFLSKGRWPVLMAKVQYGSRSQSATHLSRDIEWNRYRHDVHNLTIYVENHWRDSDKRPQELTWQVIDLSKASLNDLLQVPVLFFSGGGNPLPSDEDEQKKTAAKLRDYIDGGGFIFADGCADDKNRNLAARDFDKGFRRLMELAFEQPEYRFKPLDGSHPIWKIDEKIPLDQEHLLLGIDYGCRTSVVYAPANPVENPKPSLACLWELSRGGQSENYSPAVKEQIQGGLAIGINVLAYATNRQLVPKDLIAENPVVEGPKPSLLRGNFAVAKIRHLGGCDAAPRALANLMEQAGHDLNIRVETHPKLIGLQDPALFDYPVIFMHGRNAFRLLDGERQALRDFVQRGGLLFADAICGNEAFTESFRREMALVFPKNPLANIPAKDPIWTHKYGGSDLQSVMRRDPLPGEPGEPVKSVVRPVPPELEGMRFGDRYGVIFSKFDLSCALEKHESMECRGYTREDAARIGLNVLRYAIQQ